MIPRTCRLVGRGIIKARRSSTGLRDMVGIPEDYFMPRSGCSHHLSTSLIVLSFVVYRPYNMVVGTSQWQLAAGQALWSTADLYASSAAGKYVFCAT